MVPSPPFAGPRISPPEDVYQQQEKAIHGPSYSSGFPSAATAEESCSSHCEPLQNRR